MQNLHFAVLASALCAAQVCLAAPQPRHDGVTKAEIENAPPVDAANRALGALAGEVEGVWIQNPYSPLSLGGDLGLHRVALRLRPHQAPWVTGLCESQVLLMEFTGPPAAARHPVVELTDPRPLTNLPVDPPR